jgi:hypothetical protein
MQVPLGYEIANLYAPLGAFRGTKQLAIDAYRTQGGALRLWRRQARYLGALYGAQDGAEAFWEMRVEEYCRVVRAGSWDWKSTPFRSLSGRPLGDLAAHLQGRGERLRLRRIAEGYSARVTEARM